MLSQVFASFSRKFRTVDVWEFGAAGWRLVYVLSPPISLEEIDARAELDSTKIRHYALGRIFRLWTWDQFAKRWVLTEQS